MDLGLVGKTALVTGASKGIGYAIAARLAEEGADVALVSRSRGHLEEAASTITEAGGGRAAALPCDLRDGAEVDRLVPEAERRLGPVDIVVANTGGPPRGTFLEYGDDDWRQAFEGSVLGLVRVVRAALPGMLERSDGSILTITSSSVRQPIDGHWLSNVMRPGVWGFVKTLATDVAPHNVRANNIAPGRILTERVLAGDRKRAEAAGVSVAEAQRGPLARVPMARFGEPDEIADAAAFLVSPRARYVTGTTLHVDGGMVRSL